MEIVEGYKDTKIGRIPYDWNLISFENLGEYYGGLKGKKKEDFGEGKPYIPFMNIMANDVIDINYYDLVKIKEGEKQNSTQRGDLFFNTSSETPEEVGMCSVLNEQIDDLYLNSFCFGFRLSEQNKRDYLPEYISRFMRSGFGRKLMFPLAQGMTRYNLSKKYFLKLQIPFPPLQEQQKIAEILSTVDKQINTTQAIIDKSKELKKGLMQRFFLNKAYMIMSLGKSEKTELKPVRFNELGKILTGTTPPTAKEEYYNSKDYMFIGPADMGKIRDIKCSNKYISNMGFDVARKLPSNAIMVVCIGATIGKVGLTIEPCATNQQVNTIIPKEEYSARYLYYLISGLKKYLLCFAGDTATPQLNKTDFGKVVTFIHKSKSERDKISEILSEADAKIEKEENEKVKLEELKKGLMQQLLTGKKRVKV